MNLEQHSVLCDITCLPLKCGDSKTPCESATTLLDHVLSSAIVTYTRHVPSNHSHTMNIDKPTIQDLALRLATEIHYAYRDSYWAQQYVLQELRAELERLDREYNEST